MLWEKEKLLVTSNFSFSHSVFRRLTLQIRKNQVLFGKGLKVIWGKEKMAIISCLFFSLLDFTQGLMIVIATGFIPLSLLIRVLMMIM